MDDRYLQQFSRHILLDEIGVEGQARIASGHAVIIGAGGLGCPAALYLASAGIGRITLVDDDTVDLTNLQRQILYAAESVGSLKVESARGALAKINPYCTVIPVKERFLDHCASDIFSGVSVVLDCSDNFQTRHAVNRACYVRKIPLVSGAAVRFSGQLCTFSYQVDTPCYECLFPESADVEEIRCALMGVFAPVAGVIGVLQAAEALRIIAGVGQSNVGQLTIYDGVSSGFRSIKFRADPCCVVCGVS